MGINVQLRSEAGRVLEEVLDTQMVLSRASSGQLSGTRLLRYVVPWGDAIFNQAQSDDLAADIREVCTAYPDTPLARLLRDVRPLVDQLTGGPHLYLWFVGD